MGLDPRCSLVKGSVVRPAMNRSQGRDRIKLATLNDQIDAPAVSASEWDSRPRMKRRWNGSTLNGSPARGPSVIFRRPIQGNDVLSRRRNAGGIYAMHWLTRGGGVKVHLGRLLSTARHDCCKQRTRPKSVLGDVVVLSRNGQSWITTVTAVLDRSSEQIIVADSGRPQ